MTFEEMKTEVLSDLNLASTDASLRVGRHLNLRYHRVTAALGINTARRTKISANTTIGSNEVAFSGIEKIERLVDERTEPYVVLDEWTYDDIRASTPEGNDSNSPTAFAIKSQTSTSVTVALDAAATSAYALKADGVASAVNLSSTGEPAFPSSYHYILVEGAKADELRKMGKTDLARDSESHFKEGLSHLRLFLAKSAYLEIRQGK